MQNNGASYQFEFQKRLSYLSGESKTLGFLIYCFKLTYLKICSHTSPERSHMTLVLYESLIFLIQHLLLQKFSQTYPGVVWQGYTNPEENKGAGHWKFESPMCVLVNMWLNLIHRLQLNTIQNGIQKDQNSRSQAVWKADTLNPCLRFHLLSQDKKGHSHYFHSGNGMTDKKEE